MQYVSFSLSHSLSLSFLLFRSPSMIPSSHRTHVAFSAEFAEIIRGRFNFPRCNTGNIFRGEMSGLEKKEREMFASRLRGVIGSGCV